MLRLCTMALVMWPFLPINTELAAQISDKPAMSVRITTKTAEKADSSTNSGAKTAKDGKEISSKFARIKGTVNDSTGRPLANATVVISTKAPFSEITARTAENGEFVADSLPVGETFTVSILLLGYRPFESKPFTILERKEHDMFFVMAPREVVIRPVNKRSIPATMPKPQGASAE